MIRTYYFFPVIVCVCFFFEELNGQTIKIDSDNQPLNEVLIELQNLGSLNFSFNDKQLSKFTINAHKEFSTPEEALSFLLRPFSLEFKKIENVYIIYFVPKSVKSEKPEKKKYLTGKVISRVNSEPLPFVTVGINDKYILTDSYGNFSAVVPPEDSLSAKLAYLGYYTLDTHLYSGTDHLLKLIPKNIEIKEVNIYQTQAKLNTKVIQDEPGKLKINPIIAHALPGYGDNVIFNYMSLLPGIETTNDLSIRGSTHDQNITLFDGIKILNFTHSFKHIGTINPLLIKDIEVYKSGFGAQYGNAAGGLIQLSGKSGMSDKSNYTLNLSNTTLNFVLEQKLGKRSSLILATRNTLFNLLNSHIYEGSISAFSDSLVPNFNSFSLSPNYKLNDINAKLSGRGKAGSNYYVSLFLASENFSFEESSIDLQSTNIKGLGLNKNSGISFYWGKQINKEIRSNITLAYSEALSINNSEYNILHSDDTGSYLDNNDIDYYNSVKELKLSLINYVPLTAKLNLKFGLEQSYGQSEVEFSEKNAYYANNQFSMHTAGFLESVYYPIKNLKLGAGLRANYYYQQQKSFIEPRISTCYKLYNSWKLIGHLGYYNQTLTRKAIVDSSGNSYDFWIFADGTYNIPISALFTSGGILFKNPTITFSAEYYRKQLNNVFRLIETANLFKNQSGNARMHGIDVLLKKDNKNLSAWIAYTLSIRDTKLERFEANPNLSDNGLRHVLKGAFVYTYKKFDFSATYKYSTGEGFNNRFSSGFDYHKIDISTRYKFNINQLRLETGASVLNILNQDNPGFEFQTRYTSYGQSDIDLRLLDKPQRIVFFLKMAL